MGQKTLFWGQKQGFWGTGVSKYFKYTEYLEYVLFHIYRIYRIYRIKIELIFLRKTLSNSNFNQKFDYEF